MVCVGAAAAAHAQPSQQASLLGSGLDSSWRVFVSVGGAARGRTQTFISREGVQQQEARIVDVSPTNLHLSAAAFPHRFFGINLEGRAEFFYGCCDPRLPSKRDSTDPSSGIVFLPSADASLAAIGRARPTNWLNFEFHLGVQLLTRTGVNTENPLRDDGQLKQAFVGPMFGAAITVGPSRYFQGMLYGRFSPGFGLGTGDIQGNTLAIGAQASIGALRLGPLQAGIGPTVEFMGGGATVELGARGSRQFAQSDLRFGLGITLQQWIEARVDGPPVDAPLTLAGRVVQQDGTAAVDAKVSLDPQQRPPAEGGRGDAVPPAGSPADVVRVTTTDVQGRFTFLAVSKGPHRLEATKDGVTPASLEVNVPVASEVVVTLGAPTGPGRIVGVVKGPNGPLVATLTVGEPKAPGATALGSETVKSASDGSYALEKMGPGPVTVRVKADEFNDAEEVVQVAPGGVATLDFTMVPKAVAVQATLRGLIRAKSGEAVKATVRIVELKMRLQVKGDGRFSADVPSGKYTLIIEARGYVTQTKTVEVSGGDQAIFHTELERSR